MNRGRTDSNETLRQHRKTVARNFGGNSTAVSRACDEFFRRRGMVPAGTDWREQGILFGSSEKRKAGRCLRENKADRIAADIEQGWRE